MTEPATTRRSFIARQLASAGARFSLRGDVRIAHDFGRPAAEIERARRAAIADLSPLARAGFKGPRTIEWLGTQGVVAAPEPNRAFAQADGSMVAMLSWSEALILDDPLTGNGPSARLAAAWSLDAAPGCYALPRRDSHYWFVVTGERAPELFAKLCAVDLRAACFANGQVAQTVVAQSNAIIVRSDFGSSLAFHLLGDSASAEYMWGTVLDALGEFDGGPVGHEALAATASRIDPATKP